MSRDLICRFTVIFGLIILAVPVSAATDDTPRAYDPDYGCLAAAKLALSSDKLAGTGAAGTINYDVREYRLSLVIDPEETHFTGEVFMRFAPTVLDLTEFVMDAVGLEILSVSSATGPLEFDQAGDSLTVTLPLAMRASPRLEAEDSLTVSYRGLLEADNSAGLGVFELEDEDSGYVGKSIASFSQPESARRWWPCKDRTYDKALATVSITVPDDLTAVSNGILDADIDNADGTRTFVWVESHPIATYLVSVAINDYDHFGESCVTALSTVDIDHWVFPYHRDMAEVAYASVCDMMDFLESRFGPYPFADEKYGHAEYKNTNTGAMEHQTVTSYGSGLMRANNSKDWIVVHEMAHQWFGDSLTPADWPDIWLNEGFATYSEALWREELYGLEGTTEFGGYYWRMDWYRWGNDWIGQGSVYDSFPILDRIVYDKGAWILHMLRGRMGDTAFFALLHDWATAGGRPGSVVDTEDFITLASAHALEDLTGFFEPWLNESTIPHLEMTFTVDGGIGVGTDMDLRLVDRSGVAFDNKYPLKVTTADGDEWRTIHLVGVSVVTEFSFDSPILDVQLDPKSWVAWRLSEAPRTPLRILHTTPNPSHDGVMGIVYLLEADSDLSLEIFDVRGHRLCTQDIGPTLGALNEREILWSGRDDEGRTIPSGVYWARLTGGSDSSVIKFSVVR